MYFSKKLHHFFHDLILDKAIDKIKGKTSFLNDQISSDNIKIIIDKQLCIQTFSQPKRFHTITIPSIIPFFHTIQKKKRLLLLTLPNRNYTPPMFSSRH